MLPLILWCIRECRNETFGLSPFMMVLGRNLSIPLSLIKESWSGVNPLPQPTGKTVEEYLTKLQSKLKEIRKSSSPKWIRAKPHVKNASGKFRSEFFVFFWFKIWYMVWSRVSRFTTNVEGYEVKVMTQKRAPSRIK